MALFSIFFFNVALHLSVNTYKVCICFQTSVKTSFLDSFCSELTKTPLTLKYLHWNSSKNKIYITKYIVNICNKIIWIVMLKLMLWHKMKIPNPNTCKAALCQYITLRWIYFCVWKWEQEDISTQKKTIILSTRNSFSNEVKTCVLANIMILQDKLLPHTKFWWISFVLKHKIEFLSSFRASFIL